MIQIEILINTDSIKENENKNEHNWTLTNEWSDETTQSDSETIFKMLCKLSTRRLNETAISSTICIQQQHTDIHRNLIISNRIWQKYADKQWNDKIEK